jgi:hypothetical protein
MRVGDHIFAIVAAALGTGFVPRDYPVAHNYRFNSPRKVTFVETPKPLSKRARRRARGKGKAR